MNLSVGEARDRFTQILKLAEAGERVTITRNGKPVVDLVPASPKKKRKLGTMTGLVIDENWNRPQNDVEAWMRGDV